MIWKGRWHFIGMDSDSPHKVSWGRSFLRLTSRYQARYLNRKDIAHETKNPLTAPNPAEFTIGHNVNSKKEVDQVMEQAKRAGANITVPAHETFWGGYSGHFQDPDGHL